MITPLKNVLPERFQLSGGVRDLAIKHALDLGGGTTPGGSDNECTQVVREREAGLVGNHQYMHNLRGHDRFRNARLPL